MLLQMSLILASAWLQLTPPSYFLDAFLLSHSLIFVLTFQHLNLNSWWLCCSSSSSCAAPTFPKLLLYFICSIVLCLLPLCCVQVLYLKSAQLPASLSSDTPLLCPDFSCTLPLLPSCNCLCSDLCLVQLLNPPLVPMEDKISLPLGVCGHNRRQKTPSRDQFLLYLLCPSIASCSAVQE